MNPLRNGNISMRKAIKRPGAAAVFFTFLILLSAGCDRKGESAPDEDPGVVLRVGDRKVSIDEYHAALRRLLPEGTASIGAEELKAIKRNLVEQMIEEELILREAERLGIEVSDSELRAEVRTIKRGYAKKAFDDAIVSRYGDMERWREEIRKKLLIRKVVDRVINSRIEGSVEEARVYYEENIDDYVVPDQIRARMILVKTEEEAREVLKRLKKEDFAKVAREVSISPEAKDGGDLGFFSRGEMPEEFEEVVFKLRKGRISDIVQTPYGYHIFKVEEKKKGRKLKFDDVKDRIMEKLKREKADMEFRRWMIELKKTAKIEVREGLL